jgi:hypothetical protein
MDKKIRKIIAKNYKECKKLLDIKADYTKNYNPTRDAYVEGKLDGIHQVISELEQVLK